MLHACLLHWVEEEVPWQAQSFACLDSYAYVAPVRHAAGGVSV